MAAFFGVVSALTLSACLPRIAESYEGLTHMEKSLVETKRILETTEFDADGNVKGNSTRFFIALGRSKALPEGLRSARENLVVAIAVSAVGLAAFAACVFVVARAAKQRPQPT